ncbi:class II fructose-bisphosphate aldolase [Flavihumibacter profundi]|uniref:class II fructose-bisphosphate aldolase n=1 Tax=Flavihumibacter profundi TaxID=2716883 RepID=UPI001CC44298|nr:class II fructose-bisphosphate aldolase [Flavihumibacter profundi]MBZ5857981.1 class II fructose-bisphosphate aldolase [Flavihumibacter profundi]
MRKIFCTALIAISCIHTANSQTPGKDWILGQVPSKAAITLAPNGKDLVLDNGLLRRSFRLSPAVACTEFQNLSNGQQLLRAISPEARLVINGKVYEIGGLAGQREKAYLKPAWIDTLKAANGDFQLEEWTTRPLEPLLNWKPAGWMPSGVKQPSGQELQLRFRATAPALEGLQVVIHYNLYDGIPLVEKWLTLNNTGNIAFHLNRVSNEVLALVEEESAVVGSPEQMAKPQGIYVETNYAFNNAMRYALSDQTTHWKTDSSYTSQVNYNYQTPCILEVYPDKAPGINLQPGEDFESVRSFELLQDSYDRERRGLAVRSMYRTIAPWTLANPIFMHLVSQHDEEVKRAVDQCAATGYEALILSFGSHLDMEDSSAANIARWKSLADYAHSKGIRIGGYSLFSSRRISEEDDVINPVTGKTGGAFFGNAPCFGSKWGLAYRDKIKYFFTRTGFNIWENDGPYPGDVCASTSHPGHKGLDDSQWRQMEIQKELYHWLNERGVYINAPDWYFLDGTHKIAVGYREVNFSLPRENQQLLNRQNIYDGTWEKIPSMGWGFVPLTRYQGGGPEAVLEPLSEHLKDYEQLMMQYYGAGIQACYRGPRLYDTDTTRRVVTGVVNWYKKYREILNSDIIHLRRADGRDWDGILHVNPALKSKGLLMVYNPLPEAITRTIKVPLYYTGIDRVAMIREKEGVPRKYFLDRDYTVALTIRLEPGGYSWWEIE